MSRWGELIPHDEGAAEEGRCLCGCLDEVVADIEGAAPPVGEYRLSTRPRIVGGSS